MLLPSSRNKMEIEVVGTSRMSTITSKTAHCCNLEESHITAMTNNMPVLVLVTAFLPRAIYMKYQFSLATF